jgi:Kef-type K+ transport system membrane component KefB
MNDARRDAEAATRLPKWVRSCLVRRWCSSPSSASSLGATLGYIVGGAVIGPYVLGLINDPQALLSVTDIGIAFLLFIVGLELHPSRLWRLRRDIFGLGLAQVVLCGLALSLFIHLALGVSLAASLAIGLPLALSSTAQVLPMLRSDGDLNTPQGERAFSILLFRTSRSCR